MKVSDLQNILIEELELALSDWKFVKSRRYFKKTEKGLVWYLHLGCINHMEDFDAVGNVAVEFKAGKERVCIVGAELGNIRGTGQHRFPVSSGEEAKASAIELYRCFNEHGLPFLRKYSDPATVLSSLTHGGKEAMLISPITGQHQDQINRLRRHYGLTK